MNDSHCDAGLASLQFIQTNQNEAAKAEYNRFNDFATLVSDGQCPTSSTKQPEQHVAINPSN